MKALAELHLHLDGSLRAETMVSLAAQQGVALPSWDIRFEPGMSLAQALSRFETTLSVLQSPEAVCRVAAEICEDAAALGVETLEIRFAPQLHSGAELEEIVDAAIDGIGGRAGLILCGLYGEPPAIFDRFVEAARTRPAVVGIDLAGGPAPSHSFGMGDYAEAFGRAAAAGLGLTVHAGEGRDPSEIAVAIEALGATRIGHGTTLLEDPQVLDLVLERGVTIEACPSSNVHTGAIGRLSDHPIKRWIELGVKVCVCADNTFLSDTDAAEELRRVREACGLLEDEVEHVLACGHAASFTR